MAPSKEPDVELAERAGALADAVEGAVPGWVERSVERIAVAWQGHLDEGLRRAASEVGRRAGAEVGDEMRELLLSDVDQQRQTPLGVLRSAVRYPSEVLEAAGVPPVQRDDFAESRFPADRYGLVPASLAAVDPALSEPGLTWGAAKALVHLRRHSS